jgi:hypothetical protein
MGDTAVGFGGPDGVGGAAGYAALDSVDDSTVFQIGHNISQAKGVLVPGNSSQAGPMDVVRTDTTGTGGGGVK